MKSSLVLVRSPLTAVWVAVALCLGCQSSVAQQTAAVPVTRMSSASARSSTPPWTKVPESPRASVTRGVLDP